MEAVGHTLDIDAGVVLDGDIELHLLPGRDVVCGGDSVDIVEPKQAVPFGVGGIGC